MSSLNWKDEILLREYELFKAAEPAKRGMGPRAPLPDDTEILWDRLDAATRQSVDLTNEALAWRGAAENFMERAKKAEKQMETMLSRKWVVALAVLAFVLGVLAGGGR